MSNYIFFYWKGFLKNALCGIFSSFLTLLLFPSLLSVSHSVKANEVLKEIFKKIEIITTITKKGKKRKSETQH